jgi:phage terminase small subunit
LTQTPIKNSIPKRTLDARESRFVDEYLIDLDTERAALAAGYSPSMAKSKAYQWVSNGKVKNHVFMEVQPQINLTDTPDDDLDALSETSTETILEKTGMDADGKPVFSQVRKTKIKLHDKLNALEKLARYTGVFEKEAELAAGAFADAISDIQSRMSKAPIRRYTAQDDDK